MFEEDDDDNEDAGTLASVGGSAPGSDPEGGLSALLAQGLARSKVDPVAAADYRASRVAAAKARDDYMSMMQQGIDRLRARQAGPSDTERYLMMAQALGAPTRTGTFGETMSGLAGNLAKLEAGRRQETESRDDTLLKLQLGMKKAGLDSAMSDAKLAGDYAIKTRQTMSPLSQMIDDAYKYPEGSPQRAMALESIKNKFAPKQAAAPRQPEVMQLSAMLEDPNVPQATKDLIRARIAKLNYIKPAGEGGGTKGTWVKIADGDGGYTRQHSVTGEVEFVPYPEGMKPKDKPLPAPIAKLQDEHLETVGSAKNVNTMIDGYVSKIDAGTLKLGLVDNMVNLGRNKVGKNTPESEAYASFKSDMERMRNESLRLNKGVQTEGDAQRAWNELFANINDSAYVKKRLEEIRAINERGINLKGAQLEVLRKEFGKAPLDTNNIGGGGSSGGSSDKPAGANLSGLPRPQSKADYDKITPGTAYVHPDGTVKIKP